VTPHDVGRTIAPRRSQVGRAAPTRLAIGGPAWDVATPCREVYPREVESRTFGFQTRLSANMPHLKAIYQLGANAV
jgi:hypothetical protein